MRGSNNKRFQKMTAAGGSAGVPGPEKVIWLQIPAIKSPANNNTRIAIFIINFLQLFVFFRILCPESCE